jgi:hypothetical protein
MKPAAPMPGRTRSEFASGADAASSRQIKIKSFAVLIARNLITVNNREEI